MSILSVVRHAYNSSVMHHLFFSNTGDAALAPEPYLITFIPSVLRNVILHCINLIILHSSSFDS